MTASTRLRRIVAGTVALLVTAPLLALLCISLFGWNWLRSPLEHLALQKTGRVLTLQGDLTLNLTWSAVRLHAAQVRFANPSWAQAPQMVSAAGATVTVDVPALFQRKVRFPEVTLDQADVFLETSANGQKSWLLDLEQRDEEARIEIGRVALNQGTLGYDDASLNTHIRAEIATTPQVDKSSSATDLRFSALGRYKGQPLKAQGSGGPVLALRDTTLPYPLTLDGSVGQTSVHLDGNITGLLTLTAVDMRMSLRGDSLAQLYPLLGIAFPATRSYVTQGHLLHSGHTWRYEQFSGRVGRSDIGGFVQVLTDTKRPTLVAELRCELLDLSDLGPVVGTQTETAAVATGQPEVKGRVLPEIAFNTQRWNSVDAQVDLRAGKLHSDKALPLDKLEAHLLLRDSVLTLDPLNFRLAGGQLNAKIRLDGRVQPIQAHAMVRARKVLLARLLPAFNPGNSGIGQINGEFDLAGNGNSVGQMLANANGKLGLVVEGGQVSKLMMEKAGLHLWEILSLNLTGDRLVKLRCAVADFDVAQGVMTAQALVFDTQVTTLLGTGQVDLKRERLDLTFRPKTKNTSPVALRSPIYVRGSFAQPVISIDKTQVAARALGAVALGIINPLLALLPLIDAGPGKDSDCSQLVHDAKSWPGTASPNRP